MSGNSEATVRKFSSIVFIVIIVVFALSLSALYQAYDMYLNENPMMGYYLLIGIIGLAFSTYMFLQTRRRMKRFTIKTEPVSTTIKCSKCDLKSIRDFERGDFIFKELGPCKKCEGIQIISAIYREVKDKGKEERVFT